MVRNERELAKAIQHRESVIDLHNELIGGVEKIKDPSAIAWASVAAALASSAFFWGSPCAAFRVDDWITCYTCSLWRCRRCGIFDIRCFWNYLCLQATYASQIN